MAKYAYKGVDSTGKAKRGTIEANNEDQAKAKLKSEGFTIEDFGESKDIEIKIPKKVKNKDLSVFCKQMGSVLRAGVPVIAALDMMSQQMEHETLKDATVDAMNFVQKGGTLANGFRQHRKVFPDIMSNMVEAGESSGKLEICFERLASQFEKDGHIEAKIKGAMTYPIIVLLVVLGVVVLMLVAVIPIFANMFEEMGTSLPAATQLLVDLSNFMVAKWYIVLAIVVGIVVGINVFKKTDAGQKFFGSAAIKMPVFGDLNVKTAAATFARTFATLLASGISMIDAVDQTAGVLKNRVIRDKIRECKVQVARGVPLSKPIKDMDIFPIMLPQMMHIGEETGNIEDMMEKVADFYEDEVEIATDALTAMMEPLIIVVLATVVGGMVLAIYSPILSMYDAVDNY